MVTKTLSCGPGLSSPQSQPVPGGELFKDGRPGTSRDPSLAEPLRPEGTPGHSGQVCVLGCQASLAGEGGLVLEPGGHRSEDTLRGVCQPSSDGAAPPPASRTQDVGTAPASGPSADGGLGLGFCRVRAWLLPSSLTCGPLGSLQPRGPHY